MKRVETLMLAVILVAIAALGIHCTKKSSPTSPGGDTYLGKWIWQQSVGGFAGETRTPATVGYTQALEFSTDLTYRGYRDGVWVTEGHYTVTWEKTDWLADSGYVVRYDNSSMEQIIMWHADTLELVDICYDCFWHLYVRDK